MLSRILFVLIVLGVVLSGSFALNFLANDPGTLTLDFAGRIYTLTLLEATVAVVLGILAVAIVLKLLMFAFQLLRWTFIGGEDPFGGFFMRRRERLGLDALSTAMVAMASGDAKTAQKKAKLAEQRLMRPQLTRLINAQVADMAGDTARAETYYKALMAEDSTAFVGAQGLLGHALAEGETDRALTLASHARDLAPKDQATLETLYTLQSQQFDWASARKTLTDQRRAGHIPKLEADKREAALALAQAEDAEEVGELEHARQLAVEAAKMDPSNVEATCKAVEFLISTGSKRAASKIVTDSWRVRPHPALAAAFASIEPDESPGERRRRFQTLFELRPEHDETRFLRAELALVAEDWKSARVAIEDLRETEPSARSCAVMAAIARGEGEPDQVVRAWLARALGAPRGDASDSEINHAAMLPFLVGLNEEMTDVSETPAAEVEGDGEADGEGAVEGTSSDGSPNRRENA
ncbi:MAG: heme biosynthesis HemY N-terminal domain-containing protein [Pseudomonadota bacterium]